MHVTRYAVSFAPNSRHRAAVIALVPALAPAATDRAPPTPPPREAPSAPVATARARYLPWADLLRRIFAIDALVCERCGGTMRILAIIDNPAVAETIARHLGLSRAPARPTRLIPTNPPGGPTSTSSIHPPRPSSTDPAGPSDGRSPPRTPPCSRRNPQVILATSRPKYITGVIGRLAGAHQEMATPIATGERRVVRLFGISSATRFRGLCSKRREGQGWSRRGRACRRR